MGLDMYLYEEKYIGIYLHRQNKNGCYTAIRTSDIEIAIKRKYKEDGKSKTEIEKFKPNFDIAGARVSLPLFYWRKANAIHWFFVSECGYGIDKCQKISVSLDKLRELADRCHKVLENHKLASELLPTKDGFFFGSLEYDEYYFDDLKATAEMIDKIPEDCESDFWYLASW